ncbi:MAG: hypothetical protein IT324_19535 [Anaerolineae bacterium]|nr:hypothetical protein [Anaerolineae bacterium]
MITPDQIADLTDLLEAYLVTLFEGSDDLYGGEIVRCDSFSTNALMYTAWHESQQRRTLRVIVSEPLDEGTLLDLKDDLVDYLRQLRQDERDDQIQQYLAEGKAIGEAQTLASDYVDADTPDCLELYVLESQTDDDITRADLLGVYGPQIVLHFVPDALIADEDHDDE